MLRVLSAPAFSDTVAAADEQLADVGELYIRRRVASVKDRQRVSGKRLEDTMRQSRELGETSAISKLGNQWLGLDRRPATAVTLDSRPKYVGLQATELSRWMNAESITRHKEEKNLGMPTLRQVLKIDDEIAMRQMTKSQLAALPFDPTDSKKMPRVDPSASQRYNLTFRRK
mmetsp:Transcript_28513/g.90887  ORF Transcript_28513/g.90887 Transcript_28513/m.90887 type:complete len:172 (-) Transcript_28513:76-591(-)